MAGQTLKAKDLGRKIFRPYWLPYPFHWPQSGHFQVMPLQDMPQKFSSMHAWHMANPQRQRQQNGRTALQQWQTVSFCRRFLTRLM
jgi:hypothetical protein